MKDANILCNITHLSSFITHPSVKSQGVIALDLGGTKLASALFDPDGQMLTSRTALLEGRTGTAVGELIAQEIAELKTIVGEPRSPGPLNPQTIKSPLDVAAIGI